MIGEWPIMSGERSAMKAVHAESTRRIHVRPAAHAVVIALISKGRSASPAARAEGIANSGVNPAVRAAATRLLLAGIPRNSAQRHWNANGSRTASMHASGGLPTRSALAVKPASSTKRTAGNTTSSGSSESLRTNSMQCSSSRAADATCATSQWPVRFTSITTGHAAPETDPAEHAYVVSRTRNATRGSASSEMTRTGFAEQQTPWKKRRSECLLRAASLGTAMNPRPRLNHSGINTPLGEATSWTQ